MKKSFHYPLKGIKRGPGDVSWKLVYNDFHPASEHLREALCTVGNGNFGTRGAAPESFASRMHYPGTYIAGVYNSLSTKIAGKTVTNEDLVNCPNWLCLKFKTEESDWITPQASKILYYFQELDMLKGILSRVVRLRDKNGHSFTIESQRLAHMSDPHIACMRYVISPENYEGEITVRSGLDGTVENKGVARYRLLKSRHLKPLECGKAAGNKIHLSVETSQSRIVISETAWTRVFFKGKALRPATEVFTEKDKAVYQDFRFKVEPGNAYEVKKVVSIYTSKDKWTADPRRASIHKLRPLKRFRHFVSSQEKAWRSLWKIFYIEVHGDVMVRKILKLHTFHLLQSASFYNINIDMGLSARGLHGEAYRGHIFWDQLFAIPFYNLRAPAISRALLMYRYRRLDEARKNARDEGFRGAMFPWQSGLKGDEQSQAVHLNPLSGKWGPDYSRIQRHISFDVAYNVWNYWEDTGDMDFLKTYGAEIVLSVALFGSSLSEYSSKDKRYHTAGVMGPDEFHERLPGAERPGFTDNAYTNFMIVATLRNAFRILEILPQKAKKKLLGKLSIDDKELARWKHISKKMNIIINKEGIISQFEGYFKLKELDWDRYKKKYRNIMRMDRILKAEGKSPNDYKVAKQADVLMIFYLFRLDEIRKIFNKLGYAFDRDMLKKNYDYYIRRTSHGSTLSKVVHCYLAHLLGRRDEAWDMYLDVLKSDIYDTQGGTTPEGIHAGVMAGSIDIAMSIFAGVRIYGGLLTLDPDLPRSWRQIKMHFLYRKRWVSLNVTRKHISVFVAGRTSRKGSVPVRIHGKMRTMSPGKRYKIKLKRHVPKAAKKGIEAKDEKKILIVDGDIKYGMMLKTRLEDGGYLTEYTNRGDEALEILRTVWIDLVIIAVSLGPGMSGYRLFKEIKMRKECEDIPIIMVSKRPGLKGVFKKTGSAGYFVKPCPPDKLLKKVESLIEHKA